MREAVQNMERAVCKVQGVSDGVERRNCGAAGPKKRQLLER